MLPCCLPLKLCASVLSLWKRELEHRGIHQYSLSGNKTYTTIPKADTRRMGMNWKKHTFSWLMTSRKSFPPKNKVVRFFSVLGCILSCKCPKHPPRRGSQKPGPLPPFLSSSLRPCNDIILTRVHTEYVTFSLSYVKIAFTLAEYQSITPPSVIKSLLFISPSCNQEDGYFWEYMSSYRYEKII